MAAQMDLGGDAVAARECHYDTRCQHVDGRVRASRFDPEPYRSSKPSGTSRDGRCTRTAVVLVDTGDRVLAACRRHARPEWLSAAGVD